MSGIGKARGFLGDERAAVAPMYALALFGLIIVAGAGWDYGRLMTMDSELQNAADQAALAAATQLDGRDGAMARARNAATDFLATSGSQWVNETKLSNDGDGRPITGLTFRFYASYDGAADTFGTEITDDTKGKDARVVQVIVNGREAFFALTAIGGRLSSGDVAADAVAGLESSVCKAPKMFVCAPSRDFPRPGDTGKGLLLRTLPSAVDPLAPGNFGFLDPDGSVRGNNNAGNPNRELGRNGSLAGCNATTGIESEPGFVAPETVALNTRMDIYGPGLPSNSCKTATGDFCPSQNTVTRTVWKQSLPTGGPNSDPATAVCSATNKGTRMTLAEAQAEMDVSVNTNPGYKRDDCFATGGCSTLGDGDWSGQSYMNANHGAQALTGVSNGSRYGVYKWELGDRAGRLRTRKVGYKARNGTPPQGAIYCSYPQPVDGTAIAPSATQKDRRILTVASVDCTGLNGREKLDILRWMDLFVVDASATTGPNAGQIFTEVVGPATKPGGGYAFQTYGRNKPVLLR